MPTRPNKSAPSSKSFVWMVSLPIILWISLFLWAWRKWSGGDDGMAAVGQFGDIFGMLNTLFSGVAMAFAIRAVWLQKFELEELGKEQQRALERARFLGRPIFDVRAEISGPNENGYQANVTIVNRGALITEFLAQLYIEASPFEKPQFKPALNDPGSGVGASPVFWSMPTRGLKPQFLMEIKCQYLTQNGELYRDTIEVPTTYNDDPAVFRASRLKVEVVLRGCLKKVEG